MNLQNLVLVAVRLLALWYGTRAAFEVVMGVYTIYDAISGQMISAVMRRSHVWMGVMQCAQLMIPLLLWILAPQLARLGTRSVKGELQMPQLSLADCYAIGFVVIGTWHVIKHLASGFGWVHYLFLSAVSTSGTSWRDGIEWYNVADVFLTLVFGTVLIIYGRKWGVMLAKKHQEAQATNRTCMATGAPPAETGTK